MRRSLLRFAATAVLAAATGGCGGTENAGRAAADRAQTGAAAVAEPDSGRDQSGPRKSTPLAAALYPRCGVESFGEPRVTQNTRFGGWQLVYRHPEATERRAAPGETLQFSLEERPADSARLHYDEALTLRIHARKVDFSANQGGFTAQWVTDAARYVAFGAGSGTGLVERLVRCTP